jgi:suppressor of ftsI
MALVVASCSSSSSNTKTATPKPAANSAVNVGAPNGVWAPKTGLPLTEPVQLWSKKKYLHVDLDANTQTIDVSGSPLGARPWNGALVGPTLHVYPGDTLDVTFKNDTDEDTNIHYHGMHVSPLGEGDNIFRTFRPGGTYHSQIQIPANHDVGTFWYHVHFHGLSEGQVMGGLSGLLIVEGLEKRLPGPLRNVTQRQFAIRDVRTNGDSIVLDPANNSSSDTFTYLVNGLDQPTYSIRQGETQLWRLANIAADGFEDISLPGHKFTVIAEDGNPEWTVYTTDHLVLPPAKRFDVLVTGGAPGTYQLQTAGFPTCPSTPPNPSCSAPKPRTQGTLATITIPSTNGGNGGNGSGSGGGSGGSGGSGAAPVPPVLPTTMMTPEEKAAKDLADKQPNAPAQDWKFAFTPCPPPNQTQTCSTINGQVFDPNAMPAVAPTLGDVQDWTLENDTPGPHPFHIHVNPFQVLQVSDPVTNDLKPYDAPGLEDTVTIPAQQTINGVVKPGLVVIRNHFVDFPGWFVFHCHILSHEDDGMMLTVEVLNPGQQPSPPPHDSSLNDNMGGMTNMPNDNI